MEEYREVVGNYKNGIDDELTLCQEDKEELQANLEKLKRKTVDDVEPMVDSIEEINTATGIADGLFEGDIIISKQDLDQLATADDESRQKRQAYRNDTYPALWTDGVSYMFKQTLNKRARTAFRKAAFLWESNTCINFTELVDSETNGDNGDEYDYYNGDNGEDEEEEEDDDDDEDDDDEDEDDDGDENDDGEGGAEEEEESTGYEDHELGVYDAIAQYILVTDGEGCTSPIGQQRYPAELVSKLPPKLRPDSQFLTLGRGCETIGTAAHELGHALGFLHTHTRHDRNQFITVNKDYVNKTYASQFKRFKKRNNDNFALAYDYGSVMHYKATSTTTQKGKLTLVPKDVLYTETLGSAMISFYDLLMMNMLYNCTAACGNSTQCNGGFPHPRDCSKCICPSGYGGQFCNERPPGCGGVLNATRNWTTLEGDHNMTYGYQDGYKKCNYWITAPNNTQVQVKIANLPANVSDYGCKYAGVEIKTHTDQRLTGYRFCSRDDINTTLTSNSSTVPVMMYMRRRRNHTGIVLRYRYLGENSDPQAE